MSHIGIKILHRKKDGGGVIVQSVQDGSTIKPGMSVEYIDGEYVGKSLGEEVVAKLIALDQPKQITFRSTVEQIYLERLYEAYVLADIDGMSLRIEKT